MRSSRSVAAAARAAASSDATLLRRDRELAAWKGKPTGTLVPASRKPTDGAFWVMTSGTTGLPKAVEHHHRNVGICAQYYEQVLGTAPADRLFATSRFHFAYAIGNSFAALRIGATNILLERWATAPSVAATLERFKPTVVLSVPAVFHRLLDEGLPQTHGVPRGDLVRVGRRAHAAADLERLGGGERPSHPRRIGLLGAGLHGDRQHADGAAARLLRPRHAERRVAHRRRSRRRHRPSRTRSGRLEVRMPSVCAGYRDATSNPRDPPQRPLERFTPDGWFATGDEYARDADGFYHHRGRSGDMLRVSGLWISPSEIEDALAGIPSIKETAAVLGESEIGLAEIVLYVVPAPGADGQAAVAAARERLAQALPTLQAAAPVRGDRRSAAHRDRQGAAA